jgi:UPF0755 protein
LKKILLVAVLLAAAVAAYLYYQVMVRPAVPANADPIIVEIPRGSDFATVVDTLIAKDVATDTTLFRRLAERMAYLRNPMRSGRYQLEPGWSYVDLIRHLRAGRQVAVDVVLTTEREPMNVAAKVARFLEADSLDFVRLFQNEAYLDSIGYTPQTLQSLFIPNTYRMYWNTTPRGFVTRMLREHETFWSQNDRAAKAEQLGLTPAEVYTLASIIEKETQRNDEKERMAGVYLNRIERGIPLQADPTAVFATRDFGVPRVLNYHTQFDSPYNTYVYAGLPPGPIAMASISSIDAVLNREQHDYLYFCARGDGSGYHNFAETLAGHNRNIAVYVANLRKRGLR